MNETCNISSGRRVLLLFIVVCAVIPSLLVAIGWNHFAQRRLEIEKSEAIPSIRRDLLRLKREGVDRLYIQHRLNFLYGNLVEDDYTQSVIEANLSRFKDEGFSFINFRFFKADGSAMQIKGQSESRRAVLQKIYEALLLQETTGEGSMIVRNRPFFDAFAGGLTPFAIAQDRSSLMRVMMNGRPGYFYWNIIYSHEPEGHLRGGFVAWFSESDVPRDTAIEQLLESANFEWRGQRIYGVADIASPASSLPSDRDLALAGVSRHDFVRHLVKMRNNFESQSELGGQLLLSEYFTADRILFCLQRSSSSFYTNLASIIKIILLVWFLVVVKLAGNFAAALAGKDGSRECVQLCYRLSLRRCMLLFVSFVSLAVIVAMGFHYREVYSQMLVRESFAAMSDKLERIDENFQVAVRNLEAVYRKFAGLRATRDLSAQELERLSSELYDKDAINRIYIVDREGHTQYSWPRGKSSGDITTKIMPAISRRIFITQRGDEESIQDKVSAMMMDSFSDSFSDMLGDTGASLLRTFENLDRINEFWLANKRHYVYTSFVERGSGKDPLLLYIWHGTESFAERYLKKQVQRNIADQRSSGVETHLAMVPRNRSLLPFPRDFNKYPFVAQLSEQVAGSEIQQSLVGPMAGEKWLIAAAPLKRVPNYILFAMSPVKLIEQKVFKLDMLLLFTVLLVLISVVLLTTIIDDL